MSTVRDKTNPELREDWDYGRSDDVRSRAAIRELTRRGQIAPDGKPFTWGTVVKQHAIGDIVVIESWRDHNVVTSSGVLKPDETAIKFHPYIGGDDTNHTYGSLDEAIIGAIAIKYDGINTRADTYFVRAVGI